MFKRYYSPINLFGKELVRFHSLGLSNEYIAKKLNITKGRVNVLVNDSYSWHRNSKPTDSELLEDYSRVRYETLERIQYLNLFLNGEIKVDVGGYSRRETAHKIMNLVFLIENGKNVNTSFKYELLKLIRDYETLTRLSINMYKEDKQTFSLIKCIVKFGYLFRLGETYTCKNQIFAL